ncbi:MAG: ADOP family duplicated permease [Terriglobales bacterium]
MSFRQRLSALLGHRAIDAEIQDEIASHIQMRADELVASGVPPEDARQQAIAAFGNRAWIKEEARSFDTVSWLETLLQDVRYGLRQLARNPGFTAAAALTLALGIGANTAIFAAVNAVLLRPMPYAEPGRMAALKGSQSLPDVIDLGRMCKGISATGAWATWDLDLTSKGRPEQIDGALIGGDLFKILGVAPYLGSVFDESDDAAGKHVVVTSYDFWQTHLGGDRTVLERPLRLSGISYTIVGIMPRGFRLPNSTSQLWIPFRVGYPEAADARGAHFTTAIARLRDGVTPAQVNEELVAVGKRLGEMHPEEARTFSVMPMRERFTGDMRTPLLVLMGAVGLVLLIACGNFATLLLARGASRHGEMQVRSALGARPLRLVRQLLTESTVLSLIAGALGIGVAYAALLGLAAISPADAQKIYRVSLDPQALAFTFAVAILTGIVFGVVPAIQVVSEGRLSSAGARLTTGNSRVRRFLVITEVALALVLLAGAGLLLRSLWNLENAPLGMNPDGLLTMRLSLPATRYGPIPVQEQFLTRLDEQLRQIPGTAGAGLVTELPMSGWRMMHNTIVEGQPAVAPGQEPEVYTHEISRGFFSTIGARLLSGRDFAESDTSNSPLVAIVNETFAHRFFPGRSAIGARARWARLDPPAWITIVGEVNDIRYESPESPQEPTIYTPYTQKLQIWKRFTGIVVRPRPGEERAAADAVARAVWSIDPQLPVTHVQSMNELMAESIEHSRTLALLLGAFAALAVTLAMMGVYGLLAYLVAQRRQEVGIRIALGARRLDILWMMIRQGLPLLGAGLVAGTLGALAATRVVQKLLYGVSPTDAPTFLAVVLMIALVAMVAIVIPALRATRVDPLTALRAE